VTPGGRTPGFRVVSSERPFTGRLLTVRVDRIADADGREGSREVVEHPGAVAALVVDREGRIALFEQWRHAVGGRLLEVPAGKYDVDGEPVTGTLRRELAEELGISTVLVPDAAGVLSALGLIASEERRDSVRSFVCPLGEAGELPAEGEAELRYRGQSFELTVPLHGDVAEAFHRAHEERYGYADRQREIELVAVRTADVRPGPEFGLPPGGSVRADGPCRLDLDGSTCWLPRGWVGVRDGATLRLRKA